MCTCVHDRVSDRLKTVENNLHELQERYDESTKCVVCMDSTRQIRFEPCGHMNTCSVCAKDLAKCPVCSAKVDAKQHVFV
jgi:hypothetical protein